MTDLEFHWENYLTNKNESSRDYLCKEYEPLVYATKNRMFPGFRDSKELEQEGRLALLAAIEHFDPEKGAKFQTYALYCIRRRYSKLVNKDNTYTATFLQLQIEPDIVEESTNPEEQVIFAECRQFVSNQVATLPTHLKEVMRKRYWEGKTFKQVGEELGCSAPSIFNREKTGFKILRERIPENIFSK